MALLSRHCSVWIASRHLVLAFCSATISVVQGEIASVASPDGAYTILLESPSPTTYSLWLRNRQGIKTQVQNLSMENRRENLGLANFGQRKYRWFYQRYLWSEHYVWKEAPPQSPELQGISVLDMQETKFLLNHVVTAAVKSPHTDAWAFVALRESRKSAEKSLDDFQDRVGMVAFSNGSKRTTGQCRILWLDIPGQLLARPHFMGDKKSLALLVAQRHVPMIFIVSVGDLQVVDKRATRGLVLSKNDFKRELGSRLAPFLRENVK